MVALLTPEGRIVERVVYDPYGRGRHHYAADYDGNGAVEVADLNGTYGHLTAWFADDMQADWDRNGTTYTDVADIFAFQTDWFAQSGSAGAMGGAGQISRRYAAGSGINANAPDNMIGYCGYVFNPETDDYTVRFRHYDPEIGRWLERDMLGEIERYASAFVHDLLIDYTDDTLGISLYQYCSENPDAFTDPLGLDEHTKGARPSTKGRHEKGQKRAKTDRRGGEKGDARRPYRKGHTTRGGGFRGGFVATPALMSAAGLTVCAAGAALVGYIIYETETQELQNEVDEMDIGISEQSRNRGG